MSEPKATGKVKPRISMRQFIETWEKSESVAEVAERLGMTQISVQARASKYRSPEYLTREVSVDGELVEELVLDSNGHKQLVRPAIPLKSMPRGGGAKLDVDDAFAFLAELRGTDVATITQQSETLAVKKNERADKREAKENASA